MRSRWRWLVWLAYSSAWTVALVVPVHVDSLDVGAIDLRFLLAKTLHVAAYAVLAILSGWLRVPSRYRWLLMLFLAFHAAGTEYTQLFVEGRTSSIRDALLDLAGVALGCLLAWKWWSDPG